MLIRLLRQLKRQLQKRSAVRAVLSRLGLVQVVRAIYNGRVLARGQHVVTIGDCPLTFRVTSAVEVSRLDSMSREGAFLGRMLDSLRDGDVCWDVGANIGLVALSLAGNGRDVRVHAFEPEPRNAARLRENVLLNGFTQEVSVFELALSDKAGIVQLSVEGEVGTGTHSILEGSTSGHVGVSAVRADELQGIAAPKLIKIDVEGAEMRVLRGAEGILKRGTVRHVFVELHPSRLLRDGTTSDDLSAWLVRLGYSVVWSQRRGSETHVQFSL